MYACALARQIPFDIMRRALAFLRLRLCGCNRGSKTVIINVKSWLGRFSFAIYQVRCRSHLVGW